MNNFFNYLLKYKIQFFLLIIALLYIVSLNSFLDADGDSAKYITLANSILQGKGYADLNLPGEPQHVQYPPLLPIILLPLIYLFGVNFFVLKIPLLLFGILSIYLVYLIFKKLADEKTALLVMFSFALSPMLFEFSHKIMSETLYLVLSFAFIFYFMKLVDSKFLSRKIFFLGIFLLVLSFFSRTTGLVLIIAAFFFLLIEGILLGKFSLKLKQFISCSLLFFLPVLLWFFRASFFKGGNTSYVSDFIWRDTRNLSLGIITPIDLIPRAIHTLTIYTSSLPNMLFSGYDLILPQESMLRHALTLILVAIVLYGFILRAKNKRSILEYYSFFFIAFFSVYAWHAWPRYIFPLLPLFFFYFITGLKSAINKFNFPSPLKKNFFFLIIFLILLSNALGTLDLALKETSPNYIVDAQGKDWDNYLKAAEWIKENTPKDSVIVARKENNFYLFSERKSLNFYFGSGSNKMLSEFEENRANYVIVDEFSIETKKFLVPTIESNPNRFSLIKEIGKTKIYKFK